VGHPTEADARPADNQSEVEIVVLSTVLVLTVGVAAGLAKGLLSLVLRLIVDETPSVA
jgi:ABC-type antimicrobial peptide transport system permease subunit